MLLECKDLIKIYPSPVEGLKFPALRGLFLSVERGALVAIIGPSGAGKTTLLRLINGVDLPSSGEIWFDSKLVNNFTQKELNDYRKKVGVMYQSPEDNLIWGLSAQQNIMLPMLYTGKFPGKEKTRAHELLERVGLKGKEKRKPSQLSGGEQQRVSICVALANDPEILLADEPTGELDSYTTKEIINYFKELNRELGLSIIVATHDKRFSTLTDKTYRIRDGRIDKYHVPVADAMTPAEREEVVFVDPQGSLRLPEELAEEMKGLGAVKIVKKDGRIEIIPYDEKKKKKSSDKEGEKNE
ncbi:MAG: ABC transporter ATP-binding protein [Candidatus Hodarchaeales archaeon]|jgi:ABC-type lipoprotein export system ATPase subunit